MFSLEEGIMRLLFIFLISAVSIGVISCGGPKKSVDLEGLPPDESASYERISELKENIADEPNNLEWRYQLAMEYQKMNMNMEALKTYEEALSIDPGHSDIKYSYAELALAMGDRKKAFQSYKEILLGVDGQQYLSRIAEKFVDMYKITPVIATNVPEAFGMYSTDGNKIIYQAFKDGNWDIYEYDRVAQTNRQLTFNEAHEENPDYSPDGRYITYTSTRDDHREVDYDQKLRDIYIMDMQSNREINLTTNSSNDWRPRFSRDGKFIVFVSERNDLRDVSILDLYSNIYIMESDGSFQLQLTKVEANDGGPVMAGGESAPIYFDSNRNGNYNIFMMNTDGSKIEPVTFDSQFNNVAPDVSVDGAKIAFFSDRDGNFEIYIMNSDGNNQQRLTANPSDDVNPVLSPDGKNILFHSSRAGNYDIFELNMEQKNESASLTQVVAQIDAALVNL